MSSRSRRSVYLMLVIVMLLWSGNSLVGRAIRADVPPFTLAFLRWTGASLVAVPLAWRSLMADRAVIARHWPAILLLGAIGVGSFNAFFYSGLRYTTAVNSLLIQAAAPALVLLLNRLFFGVRSRVGQVAGVIVAALGVAFIVFKADLSTLLSMRFGRGDALILCAMLVWSLYTVLLRLKPPVEGLSFLALTILVGVVAMAPLSLLELRTANVHFSSSAVAGIAYVALFPSVIAYFLYNRAVEDIGAADVGQMLNLQPLLGALLAFLLLGEPLGVYHAIGMALILLGIALGFMLRGDARR